MTQAADWPATVPISSTHGDAAGGCTHPPVAARTNTTHVTEDPHAYDCVKITVVRSGSAILFGEFGHQHINVGDVILFAPCILFGTEPEGWVTVTKLYLDRDFVADQIFWQYASTFADWFDARQFVDNFHHEPIRLLRLGNGQAGRLMPWLDELVALSLEGPVPVQFYRMLSYLCAVLDVLAPHLSKSTPSPGKQRRGNSHIHHHFNPVREHAAQAARLLRTSPEKRWTLEQLAALVHLSPSQLGRVFVNAYGKPPMTYLKTLRAEKLARLLRETDSPIEDAMRDVGWHSRGHAARMFRQYVGVTPAQYRDLSRQPPTA